MQNEIPAGSKVGVLVTQAGVTTVRAAEVLAHMDGLVHVDLDGEAVSVDPSQIVPLDAPENGVPVSVFPIQSANSGNAQLAAELIAALTARVADLESRLPAIEAWILAHGAVLNSPTPAADSAPAPAEQETHSTVDSTPAAATGEAAAGS
jgi:hypothetical protein